MMIKRVAPQSSLKIGSVAPFTDGLSMPQQPIRQLNIPARSSSDADTGKMATQFTPMTPEPKRLDEKEVSELAQITIEQTNLEKDCYPTCHQPACDLNLPVTSGIISDSSGVVCHFAPMTPNQSKRVQNQVSEVPHTDAAEGTNQENDGSIDAVATIVATKEHDDKKTQHIFTDLSSSGLKENDNPDKGDNHLDLNQTSQQKPRGITEGKPRTPKPVRMKTTGTPEKPTGKRNRHYKCTKTPSAEAEVIDRNQAKRSCRRALNFDINDETRERETQNVGNYKLQSLSTVKLSRDMELQKENTRAGIAYHFTHSMNQILKGYIALPEEEIQSKIKKPTGKRNTHDKCSKTPSAEAEVIDSNRAKRSCRRALYFDINETRKGNTRCWKL